MSQHREPFSLAIVPEPEQPPARAWRWVIHERDYMGRETVYAAGAAPDYWDANHDAYAALPKRGYPWR